MNKLALFIKFTQKIILPIFVALLLIIVFSSTKVSAATIFSDPFTDTNGTELSSHNSVWDHIDSGLGHISSNTLQSDEGSFKYIRNATDVADSCVSADWTFPLDSIGIMYVRADLASVGYCSIFNNDSINISGCGHGAGTSDQSISLSSGPHNIKICAIGSTVTTYVDNVQKNQLTSASDFSTGKGGLYTNGNNTVDNFLITDGADLGTTMIAVSPSTSTVSVGSPFSVDVTASSSEEAFNAVRATISVSSNLSVTGIQTPSSGACNLSYTKTPTTSDPSFAGGIFHTSSSNCKVYRLVLTPTASGTGTITITGGSVKSYSSNTEILDGVVNGSFTIGTGPTPTPTPLLEFAITNPLLTYNAAFNLSGTKLSTITGMFVNGSDSGSSYPTSTTWQSAVSLSLGSNTFAVYGSDGTNQTATQTVTIDRHTLGDINGDGHIDLIDASLFAVDWDKTEDLTYILSDMNGDGVVDLTDLSILAKLQEE